MSSLIRPVTRAGQRLGQLWARQYRWWTADRRCLPDFIIIGTQKGGTTSLFHCLAEHPRLRPSWRKEVHFFDGGLRAGRDNYALGQRWYQANFPLVTRMAPQDQAFEASPLYLFHPLAAQRMARMLPDARLIVLLRNPVERAISHYFHEQRKGRESLPIMEALQAEESRLAPLLARADYDHPHFGWYSYKKRGHYAEQLARYYELFPAENLLVLSSEAFFAAPEETLGQIWAFLGVEAITIPELEPLNVGSNRTRVDNSIYTWLDDYFRPFNRELYELLGTDFGW